MLCSSYPIANKERGRRAGIAGHGACLWHGACNIPRVTASGKHSDPRLAGYRLLRSPSFLLRRANMNAQSERISSYQPFSRERRRPQTSRTHSETHVAASASKEPKWSFVKGLYALLQKLSLSVGVLVAILGLGIWLAIGFFQGKISQQYMVTVQPFEIPSAIADHVSLSGKNAADIVVDTLKDAATHASQFHGTEYYRYD